MWSFLLAFIPRAIVQGIPLLYGSTGEIITEKSGNLNLGIPGVMYVGGICGVIGSFFYERSAGGAANMNGFLAIAIPMLCCLLGSLLMGLLYCFPLHGASLLLPYRYPAGEPERDRSGNDHLRCRLW